MKSKRTVLVVTAAVVWLGAGKVHADPVVGTGIAKASWGGDVNGPGSTAGFAPANGTYTLGTNIATVTATVTKPAVTVKYADGNTNNTATTSGGSLGTTTATGYSFMDVKNLDANGSYPYDMFVQAIVSIGGFGFTGPGGSASASGIDPQYIISPGVVVGSLTLGPESSLYEARPEVDFALATFQITAPLLTDPLAALLIESIGGNIKATVSFASSSRLTFFNTLTLSPITSSDVEDLLEGASGLGTPDGLTSTLNLFSYRYDLTGLSLSADAAIGSEAHSYASSPGSVPEPGTLTLAAIGLVSFGGVAWRKRRQAA